MLDLLYDNPPAGFGSGLPHPGAEPGLGQEYLLTDSDHLVEVSNSFGGSGGPATPPAGSRRRRPWSATRMASRST
jgi:hypothetical protein